MRRGALHPTVLYPAADGGEKKRRIRNKNRSEREEEEGRTRYILWRWQVLEGLELSEVLSQHPCALRRSRSGTPEGGSATPRQRSCCSARIKGVGAG
jgi:hypothetical protein